MSGRTWDRSIAPDGTIPYRPSILDIRGAHAPLRPLVAALPVLSGCALRRSLAVRHAVVSLNPVSSRSAGHFGSDRTVSPLPHYCWSRVHGLASAGLLVESQRWGCCSWFYRASWLARGSPPTSPVALLLAFRNGAPSGSLLRVFALSLRDGVTLPGRVCLSP